MRRNSNPPGFVCWFCLNSGARWLGGRDRGRWTPCLACNANFFDKRSGDELIGQFPDEFVEEVKARGTGYPVRMNAQLEALAEKYAPNTRKYDPNYN